MDTRSVKAKMLAKIKAAKNGKVFIVKDFYNCGSDRAVRKYLREFVAEGILQHVYSGVYYKVYFCDTFNTSIPPFVHDVAEAIAKKNNWSIAYGKDKALNMLGLDTQVPAKSVFASSGPRKIVHTYDGSTIYFYHVPKEEVEINPISSMVVESLKALGKDGVDDKVISIIRNKLNEAQLKQLRKDSGKVRPWMQSAIIKITEVI